MSQLISAVQLQEPGSELIELYEVTVGDSILYFHSGLEADLSTVQFRDRTSPYTVRTYTAFPIEMVYNPIQRNMIPDGERGN